MYAIEINEECIILRRKFQSDWNKFARDILGVRLDRRQRRILEAIQISRRTSVRSGHAAGKDYVAAVGSLCFLYLNIPSKVINTAPTDRQVINIMMSEIARIYRSAKVNLGGDLWTHKITFEDPSWFLLGFKTKDKKPEDWTGFHSPNLMVVITEASGIDQATFDAIEGILTGNSRLVLIFNPNRTSGEAYQSTKSHLYTRFKMNCLNAVNVRAKKILIPGQVDYEWIDEKIRKPGWVVEISESEANKETHDFKWDGKWYKPNDLFLVKVMGEFPSLTLPIVLESGKKTTRLKKGEEITDDDIQNIIRRLVKSENIMLEIKKEASSAYLQILESYLPQMASPSEIKEWINKNIDFSEFKSPMQAMGTIMKHFGKLVDGKIVKEILASFDNNNS